MATVTAIKAARKVASYSYAVGYNAHVLQLVNFLNQACTGLWPERAWFLKIDPVGIISMRVRVCVYVSAPEAINNQWQKMVATPLKEIQNYTISREL